MILGEVYNNKIYNVLHGLRLRFGRDPTWWLTYLFAVAVCLLIDITFITIRVAFWPTDVSDLTSSPRHTYRLRKLTCTYCAAQVDNFQEIEKIPAFRARLEEVASSELQQGWQKKNEAASKGKERKKSDARTDNVKSDDDDVDDDGMSLSKRWTMNMFRPPKMPHHITSSHTATSSASESKGLVIDIRAAEAGRMEEGGMLVGGGRRRSEGGVQRRDSDAGVGTGIIRRGSLAAPSPGMPRSSLHMPSTERPSMSVEMVPSTAEDEINALVARRFGSIKR